MDWFMFGFLSAISVETFIRICGGYKSVGERKPQKRVQVSMPWYGWLMAGNAARKRK